MNRIVLSGDHNKNERGASMIEYALLVALIAVVCIGGAKTIGKRVNDSMKQAAFEVAGEGVVFPDPL